MPRAIAEPILPAPITPTFPVNTGDLLAKDSIVRQHRSSEQELQSSDKLGIKKAFNKLLKAFFPPQFRG
jgi:hypothetical protein